MIANITIYKNTGFNRENIPDGPAVLANAEKQMMTDHVVLQTQGLAYIDMQCTVDEVQDVDYVQINNTFYIVTGYQMMNENCARISLKIDPITTIGLNNMNFASGWTTRWCPSNNTMFSNIVDEPFVPSQEFVLEDGGIIGASGNESNTLLLGSTIDLSNVREDAIKFKLPDSEDDAVIVPKLPYPALETTFRSGIGGIDNKLPSICFYNPNDETIKEALTKVRSLGIDSAIVYSYQIPSSYIGSTLGGQLYSIVTGLKRETTASGIKYKYGTYQPKEMKAYSGQFHKIKLTAMLSGEESQEYRAEDIISSSGETSPKFIYYVDPQPNGTVYFRPYCYKGNTDNLLIESIKGIGWRNVPLSFTGASGQQNIDANTLLDQIKSGSDWFFNFMNHNVNTINNFMNFMRAGNKGDSGGIMGSITSEWSNQLDFTHSSINSAMDIGRRQYNYEYQKNIRAPEIRFTRSEGLQSYLPNSALAWAYHLSDIDLQRFDDYLIRYGWADFKKFEKSDMFTRKHFNFIEAKELTLICKAPMWLRQEAKNFLEGGVRIWHELPNEAAYATNTVSV